MLITVASSLQYSGPGSEDTQRDMLPDAYRSCRLGLIHPVLIVPFIDTERKNDRAVFASRIHVSLDEIELPDSIHRFNST